MATFRHNGTIHTFRDKFIAGMIGNNYTPEFAERCFSQIEGFGEYGFPESHAASFALLAYVSSWVKRYHPDVFCAALLNSQPMGFYQPAQLVRDARDHGVEVRHPDVNFSDWDCTLEPTTDGDAARRAVRLGCRLIDGMPQTQAERITTHRGQGYTSLRSFWIRSGVSIATLERLAQADAFRSLGLDRRAALWAVKGLDGGTLQNQAAKATSSARPLLTRPEIGDLFDEAPVTLPSMTLGEQVMEDYGTVGLSLKAHPMALLRGDMRGLGYGASADLAGVANDQRVRVVGIVLVRQRPGTASGVIFATLEDETGVANIIIWPKVFERHRRIVMSARLLGVDGKLQREGLVTHIVADRLVDLTHHLHALADSDDIDTPIAHADEVKRPGADAREKAARRAAVRDTLFPSRDFH
jgi:error-prone DNA polymerase